MPPALLGVALLALVAQAVAQPGGKQSYEQEALSKEHREMVDWFCDKESHEESHEELRPCVRRMLLKQAKAEENHDHLRKFSRDGLLSSMDEKFTRATRDEHDKKMYDAWCARPGKSGLGVCRAYEFKVNSRKMHDWFCGLPEHEKYGPCLHHAVTNELGEGNPKVAMRKRFIDELVSREEGQKQLREMHDDWCALAENADGPYCVGWRDHKLKNEL